MNDAEPTLREARIEDVPLLAQFRCILNREVFPESDEHAEEFLTISEAAIERLMRNGAIHAWLAYDEANRPIGTVMVLLREMLPRLDLRQTYEARIHNMYVDPKYRYSGLGKQLMGTALAWIRSQGIERVTLKPSAIARRFYRSLGFVEMNEMILASGE